MSSNDAKIDIKISDNKMKVIANYVPPLGAGNELTVEDVIEKLHSVGVTTGIHKENIKTISESDKPIRSIVVAEGIPPEQGEKARIESYFDLNERRKAMEKEEPVAFGTSRRRDLRRALSVCRGRGSCHGRHHGLGRREGERRLTASRLCRDAPLLLRIWHLGGDSDA